MGDCQGGHSVDTRIVSVQSSTKRRVQKEERSKTDSKSFLHTAWHQPQVHTVLHSVDSYSTVTFIIAFYSFYSPCLSSVSPSYENSREYELDFLARLTSGIRVYILRSSAPNGQYYGVVGLPLRIT